MYILDTDTCIYVIKRRPKSVLARLQTLPLDDVGISSITLGELQLGVEKSSRPEQNQEALNLFVAPLQILSFDERAARSYGRVRAELEKCGQVIGSLDMMIGAHALGEAAILVTNNLREFRRIEGLRLENWVE